MIERFDKLTKEELAHFLNNEWDQLPALFDDRTLTPDELGAFIGAFYRAMERQYGKRIFK
jgi:hypothetical protein